MTAEARVRRVIAQGRRIADRLDPLGVEARAALPGATGLSPEGVELALTEHLETDPGEAEIVELLAKSEAAAACHVVLSAHVCTAALRAIAIAVAAAPAVRVRASRRDPVLAALLVRALSSDEGFRAAGGEIAEVAEIAPARGDLLHVYGSDEAIGAHRAAHPGAELRGHGSGAGLALVGAGDELLPAARAIAADVVPFDQRGCLSPRWVLVEGDAARAAELASLLDAELAALGARVPRGPLDPGARAEIAMYRSTALAIGTCFEAAHHVIGVDHDPRALPLPPAARVVHVAHATASSVGALLAPWASLIAAVGASGADSARAVEALCPRARRSALGAMQRPPLDGPVDLRGPGPARSAAPPDLAP